MEGVVFSEVVKAKAEQELGGSRGAPKRSATTAALAGVSLAKTQSLGPRLVCVELEDDFTCASPVEAVEIRSGR